MSRIVYIDDEWMVESLEELKAKALLAAEEAWERAEQGDLPLIGAAHLGTDFFDLAIPETLELWGRKLLAEFKGDTQ